MVLVGDDDDIDEGFDEDVDEDDANGVAGAPVPAVHLALGHGGGDPAQEGGRHHPRHQGRQVRPSSYGIWKT